MKNTKYLKMIWCAAMLSILVSGNVYPKDMQRLPHHRYGDVVMNNYSEKNGIASVVFSHWLHRSKYTCRLCHEDLKFAMKGNDTDVREDDNRQGKYCGACHDGKTAFGPTHKKTEMKARDITCKRCHSYKVEVKLESDFYPDTKKFPRSRFGNGINWIKAEQAGQISPVDSMKAQKEKKQPDAEFTESIIDPAEPEMPRILFPHDEHAAWTGCGLCHPEPFKEAKGSKFTMEEIMDGKYCGICHGRVAFPVLDCQRCHTKPAILGR